MTDALQAKRLADYQPPDFLVDHVDLDVRLDPSRTIVEAQLSVRRRPGADAGAALALDGEQLDLISISVDGETLPPDRWSRADNTLTIMGLGDRAQVSVRAACAPLANTALSGLYLSNGMFCTQCEAEGFRRIAFFPDRPDVLATYRVRIEADAGPYPVLLANGNLIEEGPLPEGRRYAVWEDPFPKPSYLFALVAGDLACVEDDFTTRSGRRVALRVYVEPANRDKCGYTLDALKRAMRWDEETYGREYDLDIFMIVAVDHFNFGAMENKGLNVFNSAYVLASPQTATDRDYELIESIVAHEYFHNWSGNRVTCRDWFQLCLKEGFTVFRDQEFSADMRSAPVQRIKDVRMLWASQFPEDAGPLAHPPRPESYIAIDNFYTATVYEKGAEIVRMLKRLLGPADFRKASDLYFDRHDGSAATVEDFVRAMEDASGRDLGQFRRWWSDAGTPRVRFERAADGSGFAVSQETAPTPGQNDKAPRHIPIAYAAFDAATGALRAEGLFELRDAKAELRLPVGDGERLVLSPMQGLSAPVTIEQALTLDDRLLLARVDADPFNRWAAVNGLWRELCLAHAGLTAMDNHARALDRLADALGESLEEPGADAAFLAELIAAPAASELAQEAAIVDPAAIVAGRAAVRERLARRLLPTLSAAYERLRLNAPYAPDAGQAGSRALRNACLGLLVAAGEDGPAVDQARAAANMTDEAAAVSAIAASMSAARPAVLAAFYEKWRGQTLVVNKWLAFRAMTPAADALDDIIRLLAHEAYDPGNPNKVRALIGVFARENLAGFHRVDGRGYDFLVDRIAELDASNPQVAARLVSTLESWRKLEPVRRERARAALGALIGGNDLSPNVYEMAARLLGDAQPAGSAR